MNSKKARHLSELKATLAAKYEQAARNASSKPAQAKFERKAKDYRRQSADYSRMA